MRTRTRKAFEGCKARRSRLLTNRVRSRTKPDSPAIGRASTPSFSSPLVNQEIHAELSVIGIILASRKDQDTNENDLAHRKHFGESGRFLQLIAIYKRLSSRGHHS